MSAARIGLVAILLLVAQVATAHVPDECRPLFHTASKMTEAVIRKGNEANEVAMAGLDRGRRVGAHDYSRLADRLAQLLGCRPICSPSSSRPSSAWTASADAGRLRRCDCMLIALARCMVGKNELGASRWTII